MGVRLEAQEMNDIKHHNHLGNNFYAMPRYANQVMSRKEVQETVAATGGWIMANGEMYDIVTKSMAGAYVVTLKRKEFHE
jgi:hypothetical protein